MPLDWSNQVLKRKMCSLLQTVAGIPWPANEKPFKPMVIRKKKMVWYQDEGGTSSSTMSLLRSKKRNSKLVCEVCCTHVLRGIFELLTAAHKPCHWHQAMQRDQVQKGAVLSLPDFLSCSPILHTWASTPLAAPMLSGFQIKTEGESRNWRWHDRTTGCDKHLSQYFF